MATMAMDPYKILGLEASASTDEVKKAYRKLARENHPDLHPGDEVAAKRMNEINEAYDRIMNPDKYAAEDARRAAADAAAARANGNRGPRRPGQEQQQDAGYYQQQGRYGWSGDFGFDDLFGGFYTAGAPIHPQAKPNDPEEIKIAIDMIDKKQFKEANKVLYRVKSTDRNARWYYVIAVANHGAGNTMLAMDQIKRAVEMEPSNQEYQQAARSIQASGRVYRETGESRGFSMGFMDPTTLCCMCLAINMCMGGGVGCRFCVPF